VGRNLSSQFEIDHGRRGGPRPCVMASAKRRSLGRRRHGDQPRGCRRGMDRRQHRAWPAYRFRTPSGHAAEIFWDVERYAAPVEVRSRFRNRPQRRHTGASGVAARFLHHVNLSSTGVAADRSFFADILGFRTNELLIVPERASKSLRPWHVRMSTTTSASRSIRKRAAGGSTTLPTRSNRGGSAVGGRCRSRSGPHDRARTGEAWAGESFFLYVRDPGSEQRIEIYGGGYLNFEPDRPTIVWSVAELPHPLLAWGGEIPASFGGGRPPDQLSSRKT